MPTIRPPKAKPGHRFTIHDKEQARLDEQSTAKFAGATTFTAGLTAHSAHKKAHGHLPGDAAPGDYNVSVIPGSGAEFTVGPFTVVAQNNPEVVPPYITPTEGPQGSDFSIKDGQKRIQQGDLAIFYIADPEVDGVVADSIQISPDGYELMGKVPAVPAANLQYFVTVCASASGEGRFEDLPYMVTS